LVLIQNLSKWAIIYFCQELDDPIPVLKASTVQKILFSVVYYAQYAVCTAARRNSGEKGGVKVDHATLNHWIVRYSFSLAMAAKNHKCTIATSWHRNETYVTSKANEFACIKP
jgi:hypothetical protein